MICEQETRDTTLSLTLRDGDTPTLPTCSDSLDIFTMSPMSSPSLDEFPPTLDSPTPPNSQLSAFNVCESVPGYRSREHNTHGYTSSPSTPNSASSFSFSPPGRAYAIDGMSGGTSYGTDDTSLFGGWSPNSMAGVDVDDNEVPFLCREKGKAVWHGAHARIDPASMPVVESVNGKGKSREVDPEIQATPFEFDFEFQQQGDVIDLTEPHGQPVVRLFSGLHYRQLSQSDESSAGPSRNISTLASNSTAETFNVDEPIQSPSSFGSSPSPVPSSIAHSSGELSRSRLPTHRRSLSSISIRSIRSSSSRSIASIRSAVGGASIGRPVKAIVPAAKKLRGSLRKMFRRSDTNPTGFRVPPGAGDWDSKHVDENHGRGGVSKEQDSQAEGAPPIQGHVPEASADSDLTVAPTASGAMDVANGLTEGAPILAQKSRSMSAPLPYAEPLREKEQGHMQVEIVVQETWAPNWFNDILPRELQLAVLRTLVDIHEVEHARAERDDGSHSTTWTARLAGRTRWVGREKGFRELVKFTRISKLWQALALDGQLWSTLHLRSAPPHLALTLLLRIAEHAGSFVRSLDLCGWSHLDSVTLRGLVRCLTRDSSPPVTPAPPFPPTNLTHLALRTCTALTAHSLHHVLLRAPALRSVDLHGLGAVTNTTCGVLGAYCPQLVTVDLRRCMNMDGEGLADLVGGGLSRSWTSVEGVFCGACAETDMRRASNLRVLRASGLRAVDENLMTSLAQDAPDLEVLDLSGAKELTDDAMAAFMAWDDSWDDPSDGTPRRTKVELRAHEAGRDPAVDHGPFFKRVTRLRHLSLSACPLLTDETCTHLAYCVPQLEFLELAGIGPDLKDDGLVRLLGTTPRLRRLDLEDACDITDAVLEALTPSNAHSHLQTGHALEHLVLSYALNVSTETLLTLIRSCTSLVVLECDNTRISGTVVREFVKLARERQINGAEIVAVDCRAITESLIKDLAVTGLTRARRGYRHYEARTLGYVDKRDGENLGAAGGLDVDDCDEARVLLKSFWSWQGVDALQREREKRRKLALSARRNTDSGKTFDSLGLLDDDLFSNDEAESSTRPRWLGNWTRMSGSGASSPSSLGFDEDRGCLVM